MLMRRLLRIPCPGLLHIPDAGQRERLPASRPHRACSALGGEQRNEKGQAQRGMPSLCFYRKAAFGPWLCWKFAGVKCCAGRGPIPVRGETGSQAPGKVLPSQCPSGPDPALPAGARRSLRHRRRARSVKSICDPQGGSLAGCKSWIILFLLLAVEVMKRTCLISLIYQRDFPKDAV